MLVACIIVLFVLSVFNLIYTVDVDMKMKALRRTMGLSEYTRLKSYDIEEDTNYTGKFLELFSDLEADAKRFREARVFIKFREELDKARNMLRKLPSITKEDFLQHDLQVYLEYLKRFHSYLNNFTEETIYDSVQRKTQVLQEAANSHENLVKEFVCELERMSSERQ